MLRRRNPCVCGHAIIWGRGAPLALFTPALLTLLVMSATASADMQACSDACIKINRAVGTCQRSCTPGSLLTPEEIYACNDSSTWVPFVSISYYLDCIQQAEKNQNLTPDAIKKCKGSKTCVENVGVGGSSNGGSGQSGSGSGAGL